MGRILLNAGPAEEKLPLLSSKFLGTPDVWEGFNWPATKDENGKIQEDNWKNGEFIG